MIVVSRLLSVSTTCYSLDLIPFTTLWGLALWGLIVVAVVFGFLYMYKNLDKIEAFISKYFGERKINQTEKHNKK
jgi:multisubunit Na+/H+ antiporter MnhB subunit